MKKTAKKESFTKELENFFSSNTLLMGLFILVLFLVVYLMFDKMMNMEQRLNNVESNGVMMESQK